MAVVIRLRRTGVKRKPHSRIVVCDKRSPRDGKFIELLGHYDQAADPATVVVDKERAQYWLSKGALPSETVRSIFKKEGII